MKKITMFLFAGLFLSLPFFVSEHAFAAAKPIYRVGFVYIFNDNPLTKNSGWQNTFNNFTPKLKRSIEGLSEGKWDVRVEMIGSFKTDIFNWNPAILDPAKKGGSVLNYGVLPGSSFGRIVGSPFGSDTDGERFPAGGNVDIILREARSKIRNFSPENYNKIFYVFGNFGPILPTDNDSLRYLCSHMFGIIGGYADGQISENSISSGGLVDCGSSTIDQRFAFEKYYKPVGWHIILHEILHTFGAVDIYETGTVFVDFDTGVDRETALRIDPRANESVMGNDQKPCMSSFNCTQQQLDNVYIDGFNLEKIKSSSSFRSIMPKIPFSKPDLSIENVVATPNRKVFTISDSEENLNLRFAVKNKGGDNTGQFVMECKNNGKSSGGIFLNSIGPMQSVNERCEINFKPSYFRSYFLRNGKNIIEISVDDQNSVSESNEKNNKYSYTFNLNPPPTQFGFMTPIEGNTLRKGQNFTIRWFQIGDYQDFYSPQRVSLGLYRGGRLVGAIANNIANSGSYNWRVPIKLVSGGDYSIKIVDPKFPSNYSESPKFSLISSVSSASIPPLADILGVFLNLFNFKSN